MLRCFDTDKNGVEDVFHNDINYEAKNIFSCFLTFLLLLIARIQGKINYLSLFSYKFCPQAYLRL